MVKRALQMSCIIIICIIIGKLVLVSQKITVRSSCWRLSWWLLWFNPILKVLGVKHIQRSIKINKCLVLGKPFISYMNKSYWSEATVLTLKTETQTRKEKESNLDCYNVGTLSYIEH